VDKSSDEKHPPPVTEKLDKHRLWAHTTATSSIDEHVGVRETTE